MRRIITITSLIVIMTTLMAVGWGAELRIKEPLKKQPMIAKQKLFKIPPHFLKLMWPDLTVKIYGPPTAVAGDDIPLRIIVGNPGNASAPGTKAGNPGYQVDVIFSSDNVIPMEAGVQPVYAGFTEHDFVEDMLMIGGRISNTDTIPKDGTQTYSLTTSSAPSSTPGSKSAS